MANDHHGDVVQNEQPTTESQKQTDEEDTEAKKEQEEDDKWM